MAHSCEQSKWLGRDVTLDAAKSDPDLILIRLAPYDVFALLPPKEREVANLLVEGFLQREISEKLSIACNTIRNQVTSIYWKTCVKIRLGLMASVARTRQK